MEKEDKCKKALEELLRVEKVVAINNRAIRNLAYILKILAKQIGCNSSDVRKIVQAINKYTHTPIDKKTIIDEDLGGFYS